MQFCMHTRMLFYVRRVMLVGQEPRRPQYTTQNRNASMMWRTSYSAVNRVVNQHRKRSLYCYL